MLLDQLKIGSVVAVAVAVVFVACLMQNGIGKVVLGEGERTLGVICV